MVNVGDMYIQTSNEDANDMTLEEVFNKYDIYENAQSTALMKTQDMPPAVPNSNLLGRKDEFSL